MSARSRVPPKRTRLSFPGLVLGAVLVAGLLATGASAWPDALPTKIVVYSPFAVNGGLSNGVKVTATASGYCWTSSEASSRPDAWRCFRGNYILDPCFSSGLSTKWVACPVGESPVSTRVLRLNLTKPLPVAFASKASDPTAHDPITIQLTSGATCNFAEGATATIAGLRLNYECPRGVWLVGDPHRNTATWTIFSVPNLNSREMATVEIASAYW